MSWTAKRWTHLLVTLADMNKYYNYWLDRDREDRNFLNYYWFKDEFSDEDINRLEKEITEIDYEMKDGVIFTKKDNLEKLQKIRKSKVCWLPENNHEWLFKKITNCADVANKSMWHFELVGVTEKVQYSIYPPTGGHYDWHMDIGNGTSAKRKISIVVQLSDPSEYEGGELVFKFGVNESTVPKKKGALVCFPSFFLHKVTPVRKGIRKSLVAWISGPALR